MDIYMTEKTLSDDTAVKLEIRKNILDHLNNAIYVSDMATNKILFANAALCKSNENKPLTGKVCWEALRNRSKRCDDCPIPYLLKNPGKSLLWEMCAEGGRFQIYDSIIPWINGKLVHMQSITEIV